MQTINRKCGLTKEDNPQLFEYFMSQYEKCGFRVVQYHLPIFQTKKEVDNWIKKHNELINSVTKAEGNMDGIKDIFNDIYRIKKNIDDIQNKYKDSKLLTILLRHIGTEKDFNRILMDIYPVWKKFSTLDVTDNSFWEEIIKDSESVWQKNKQVQLTLDLINYMTREFELKARTIERELSK